VKKIAFSIFIFLITLEVFLRITGVYKNYSEKSSGFYIPQYRQYSESWFHTWTPNSTVVFSQSEFEYINKINEFGHREKSVLDFISDTSSIKIVCLGDSFTEGDGAPYDSSWVRSLELLLNTKDENNFKLYNAGSCGSDVLFNFKILSEKLINLNPSIVIECLNTSDIYDLIYRGGEERFNDDGTTHGKVGPKWERLYKNLHLFRAFIRTFTSYNSNLVKEIEIENIERKAIEQVYVQVKKTAEFCKNKGITYVLLLQPVPAEIRNQKEKNEFSDVFANKDYAICLLKPLNEYYKYNNIDEHSWHINGHFNSEGYWNLGNIIYQELINHNALQFNSKK
jgi:hypothetical protein